MNEIEARNRMLKEARPFKPEKFASLMGVGVDVVLGLVNQLKDEGYSFQEIGDHVFRSTGHPSVLYDASRFFQGRHLKFGVVSDTHLGSKLERLDYLEVAYDVMKSEGIKAIFHAGDMTDGWGVYKGQEFELKVAGQEEQIEYAIANYPKRDRIKTLVISGNHDLRAYEKGGADPLVQIARARPDILYLGQVDAQCNLSPKVVMELMHPSGNVAYALSYKAQRDINNRETEQLPDILIYGHYHTSFFMHYRNINFLQAPCFKNSGLWEKSKGLNPTLGCWTVEATLTSDLEKVQTFKPQLLKF